MRDAFGVQIYPMTDVSCPIQTYLRYTLPDCAVWVLVIMTIERMVGVLWPHHVRDIFAGRLSSLTVLQFLGYFTDIHMLVDRLLLTL